MEYPSIQYVAAYADGEGCFLWKCGGSKKPYHGTTAFKISNTYLPILKSFQQMFGGKIRKKYPKSDKWRTCWEWELNSEECRSFIRMVLPYLIEKQEQARLLLVAFNTPTQYRMPVLQELKDLKRVDYGHE